MNVGELREMLSIFKDEVPVIAILIHDNQIQTCRAVKSVSLVEIPVSETSAKFSCGIYLQRLVKSTEAPKVVE